MGMEEFPKHAGNHSESHATCTRHKPARYRRAIVVQRSYNILYSTLHKGCVVPSIFGYRCFTCVQRSPNRMHTWTSYVSSVTKYLSTIRRERAPLAPHCFESMPAQQKRRRVWAVSSSQRLNIITKLCRWNFRFGLDKRIREWEWNREQICDVRPTRHECNSGFTVVWRSRISSLSGVFVRFNRCTVHSTKSMQRMQRMQHNIITYSRHFVRDALAFEN